MVTGVDHHSNLNLNPHISSLFSDLNQSVEPSIKGRPLLTVCTAGGGRVRRDRKRIGRAVRSGGGCRRGVWEVSWKLLKSFMMCFLLMAFVWYTELFLLLSQGLSARIWKTPQTAGECVFVSCLWLSVLTCLHVLIDFLSIRQRLRARSSRSSWSGSGRTWELSTWRPHLQQVELMHIIYINIYWYSPLFSHGWVRLPRQLVLSISTLFTGRFQPCIAYSANKTTLCSNEPSLFTPNQLMEMNIIHIATSQKFALKLLDIKMETQLVRLIWWWSWESG